MQEADAEGGGEQQRGGGGPERGRVQPPHMLLLLLWRAGRHGVADVVLVRLARRHEEDVGDEERRLSSDVTLQLFTS